MNTSQRFWAKVAKADGCWPWLGAIQTRGYGSFGITPGRTALAHRVGVYR